MTDSNIPEELIDFIERVIPTKYRTTEYCNAHGRLIKDIEYMSPQGIIFIDKFFKDFHV